MARRSTPKVFALLPAFVLALGTTACGEEPTDETGLGLVNPGKLTVCTGLPYEPFQFEQNGEIVGFDVDLVDLVAADIGVEQEIVDTPFDGIQSGVDLDSGKCDLAAAGMTITETRDENFDFSDPYFKATQALVANKDSGYDSLESLAGKKLAVQNKTTGQEYAEENAPEDTELVVFEDLGLLLAAVETGQVDAGMNDNGVLYDWVQKKTDFAVTVEFNTGEQYGFGVKTGNTKLLDIVNRVLADARASGKYDEIYQKWFGKLPDEEPAGSETSAPAGSS